MREASFSALNQISGSLSIPNFLETGVPPWGRAAYQSNPIQVIVTIERDFERGSDAWNGAPIIGHRYYDFQLQLPNLKSHVEAHVTLQQSIFHWHMAWFVYKVSKCWRWFGHVLPTELMEDEPAFEGEDIDDSGTEADSPLVGKFGFGVPARNYSFPFTPLVL